MFDVKLTGTLHQLNPCRKIYKSHPPCLYSEVIPLSPRQEFASTRAQKTPLPNVTGLRDDGLRCRQALQTSPPRRRPPPLPRFPAFRDISAFTAAEYVSRPDVVTRLSLPPAPAPARCPPRGSWPRLMCWNAQVTFSSCERPTARESRCSSECDIRQDGE